MANYVRSTTATFTHIFKDANGNPLVPLNPSYPALQVKDPTGAIIASGIATPTGTPGEWTWNWSVSIDATLGIGWKVDWVLVDISLNNNIYSEAFGLIDQIETPDGFDRTGGYLNFKGYSERLIWSNANNPQDINLIFRDSQDEQVFLKTKAQLTYLYADGYHTYYWDTTAATDHPDEGQYLTVWRYRLSNISQYNNQTQWFVVPYDIFWYLNPHLKLLIDKLNKKTDTPLSYLDIEEWQCFDRGLGLYNSVHPRTAFTWSNFPEEHETWWIIAASLYALNSRQLLEIELSHNLSAQTVSLEYDHVGPLGEVLSRLENYLWEKLMPAKLAMWRQAAGPGSVAVRPARLTYRNRVYRAGTSSASLQDFPGILNRLGIWY